MSSVSQNGVLQAEYVYNALGQQVIRRLVQDQVEIHSIHDYMGNRIAEYGLDLTLANPQPELIREYIWLHGEPVAVIEQTGTGPVTYFIRTDHIGRPVFATDDRALLPG